jgi:SAM-dependent methyltransferase
MKTLYRSLGHVRPLLLSPQPHVLTARNCFIKTSYRHREQSHYFNDTVSTVTAWQPYVYFIAGALAATAGARWIIDLGCGNGFKLSKLYPRFEIVGVDTGPNLAWARRHFPRGHWIAWDLDRPELLGLDPGILKHAVVISSDVIEHLPNPARLLQTIKHMLGFARFAVLSTPDRDLTRGAGDDGPPANPHHIREWSRTEFNDLLRAAGFRVVHCGLTESNSVTNERKTILAVIEHGRRKPAVARSIVKQQTENARRKYARHYGVRRRVRSRTDPVSLQFDAALALFKAGHTAECVQRLLAILAIAPGNRPSLKLLNHIIDATLRHATNLHRAGNLEEAEFLYRQVLDIHPRHPLATQLLAIAERQQLG